MVGTEHVLRPRQTRARVECHLFRSLTICRWQDDVKHRVKIAWLFAGDTLPFQESESADRTTDTGKAAESQ
jgi:hypothetical protein